MRRFLLMIIEKFSNNPSTYYIHTILINITTTLCEKIAYSEPVVPIVTEKVEKDVKKSRPNISVDKKNSTKSLKVPSVVHMKINLLESFMDKNKMYAIL